MRTAVKLKGIVDTERLGVPLLLWRDEQRVHHIFELEGEEAISLGRRKSSNLVLASDSEARTPRLRS